MQEMLKVRVQPWKGSATGGLVGDTFGFEPDGRGSTKKLRIVICFLRRRMDLDAQ